MRDGRFSQKHIPKELREVGLRYIQQLHTAEVRGVEWKFTFDQWWKVWQDSGRWSERGCGADKYCMCRFGDVGPYAPENVFIATNRENSSAIDRTYQKKRTHYERRSTRPGRLLPLGVRTQAGKYYATRRVDGVQRHVGTFATPELAHAAYLNFTA